METKYFKFKIENLINITKIVTVHYYELSKDFNFNGESHDFWELVYVDKENVNITRDNDDVILYSGQMIFHRPNEFHTIAANKITAPNVFIISFECKSEAMPFFDKKIFRISESLKPLINTIIAEAKQTFKLPFFNPNLRKLILQDKPSLGGQQIIRSSLEQLLIYIMRQEQNSTQTKDVFIESELLEKTLTNDIIALLEKNLCAELTLNQICETLNYSKTLICCSFKKHTNHSIMNYYVMLKIKYAKKLLREQELNIKQISDLLCFAAPNYFTKTFKRLTNMTPSQFLKSIKQE